MSGEREASLAKDSDLLLYSGEQLGVSLIRVLGILGDGNLCFAGLHLCVS